MWVLVFPSVERVLKLAVCGVNLSSTREKKTIVTFAEYVDLRFFENIAKKQNAESFKPKLESLLDKVY